MAHESVSVLSLASYNPAQNIWHKVKKYSKIGQDFKNVISNFACFLTAIVSFYFWKEYWAPGCVSTRI